jgi:hypothetical protein
LAAAAGRTGGHGDGFGVAVAFARVDAVMRTLP